MKAATNPSSLTRGPGVRRPQLHGLEREHSVDRAYLPALNHHHDRASGRFVVNAHGEGLTRRHALLPGVSSDPPPLYLCVHDHSVMRGHRHRLYHVDACGKLLLHDGQVDVAAAHDHT